MKFIITVDTEADNQWKLDATIRLENLRAVPAFQSLCERYSYIPTYFITYEVAISDMAVELLRTGMLEEKLEVGTHLHPWTTPPYFNEQEEKTTKHFPCELDDEYLAKKFSTLHDLIAKRFGRAPTSFRAGRWGVDDRVLQLLATHGYIVDCSVTPFVDWGRTVRGGHSRTLPNFMHAPYLPSRSHTGVVEIPMTILPKGPVWMSRLGGLIGRGALGVRWCRIFPETTLEELQSLYYRARSLGLPYLEFMVHSSELAVGLSPMSKTPAMVEHFNATFAGFLEFLRNEGVTGITASNAAREWGGRALETHNV